MNKQLFEGVEVIGILVIGIVITWDDIHSDTIFAQLLKKMFAVSIQCLGVDESSVLIVITQMDDVVDIVLNEIREKNICVKLFLIINKDFTAASNAAVCVIQKCYSQGLFLNKIRKVGVSRLPFIREFFLLVVVKLLVFLFHFVNPASEVIDN